MNAARLRTMRAYVAGQLVEIWEDPDRPFGCAAADLRDYVNRKAWVTLFNAVVLTAGHSASELGS
jgi:hypothetical protein